MLLVFLLLSGVGGILTAGFAMPFVGVATAITGASEDFFNELPDDFNALEPSQISIIKASDNTARMTDKGIGNGSSMWGRGPRR